MSQTGRPRVLDDTKRQVVCAILAQGSTLAEAARYIGCAVCTLQREQRRNERFREQVREAQIQGKLAPYQIMRKAAGSNWRAASWMIARDDAKHRDRRSRVSVDDFAECSLSEASKLAEQYRRDSRRRTSEASEIAPEFEELFPKFAAFMREHRARRAAESSTSNSSETEAKIDES